MVETPESTTLNAGTPQRHILSLSEFVIYAQAAAAGIFSPCIILRVDHGNFFVTLRLCCERQGARTQPQPAWKNHK